MLKKLEHRSYSFEISAEEIEQKHIITGRPIVYNSRANIGLFDEIIMPGALKEADLKDVRFLVNHDTKKIPLARSRRNNGNSTMRLIPDEQGLAIEVQLDIENNSEARALYSAVRRGDISGMSFMFSVNDEEWESLDSDHPTRHIRKIGSVVEVSAVTFPAYESTEISARSKEALDNARSMLKNVKQNEPATDDKLILEKLKTHTLSIRYNHNHDSKGRFSSGGGGGGGGGKINKSSEVTANKASANALGEMSREERKKWLDDAPDGATISGLINKRTGNEAIVRKERGYQEVYGGIGAGSRIEYSTWRINGDAEPRMAQVIRTAYEGTNQYYSIKK